MRGLYWIVFFVLFLGCVRTVSYTKGIESEAASGFNVPRQTDAARKEMKKIHTRDRIRDLQLQNTIRLYTALKREAEVYSHKNRVRDQFIFEQSLKIARNIFLDKQADQMRLKSLQEKIHPK